MKRFSLVVVMLLFAVASIFAQRSVTGTVVDASGEPLIGANILVKGTTIGNVTDFDGTYSVTVPDGSTTLVFSYTGYENQEVELGTSNVVNVTLSEGITLTEAVVTGLNISKDRKTLSSSVQQVDGEQLNSAVNNNVVEGLGGKVSGVQVINSSGASVGGTSKIRIRGATGLTGGNPLFVVDGIPLSNANFTSGDELTSGRDYGSLINDINPEDVESVSVLKGPAATAIYGERGKHGVILISMKKGKNRKGLGVDINSSLTVEDVYILPEYQNDYGGGYTQDFIPVVDPVDGQTYNTLNYSADESWGPRMDGTQYRPWWSWYPGTPDYGTTIPMAAQPDNVRDFFDTGITLNNSISLNGGNENTNFRFSYKNTDVKGVMPNSSLIKNNIGIIASTEITKDLTLSVNVSFVTDEGKGRPKYGYAGDNVVGSFNQWFQRQVDMERLREYKNPDGSFRSWNIRSTSNIRPLYWDSPFTSLFENFSTDSRDRYFGNIKLNYRINDHFTLSGSLNRDDYSQRIEQRTASGVLDQSGYSEFVAEGREDNYEAKLIYNNRFGDFSVDAMVGVNRRVNDYHSNNASTAGGLNAPNLFNLSASTDRPGVSSFISKKEVNSVLGSAELGFKNFFYLTATLRNDWSSALPTDNNSYLYPSVGFSFVFSELLNSDFISYGKLRGSVAQVGSDIGAYQTGFVYGGGTPYGNLASFTLPNTLVNQDILPALSTSYEGGIDLKFFRNRIGLDLTYYRSRSKDEIIRLTVPGSSGFTSAWINAGKIVSSGFEVSLSATPIETKDLTWDIGINFATNDSQVEELSDGLDNYVLDGRTWGGLSINAPVGEQWGQFRGRKIRRDANGTQVISQSGSIQYDANTYLGTFLPDVTGGVRTDLTYKGFRLGAFVDFQIGGQFHSITKMFSSYSGLAAETSVLNDNGKNIRDDVSAGGGVRVDGVLADGTPHTVYVEAQSYFGSLFALHEKWLYDASYAKLRELSLGYDLPTSLIQNTPFRNIGISLVGKNLWLIHSEVEGIDPSEISPGSNNYVFQEGAILPGVRSIGINVRLGL